MNSHFPSTLQERISRASFSLPYHLSLSLSHQQLPSNPHICLQALPMGTNDKEAPLWSFVWHVTWIHHQVHFWGKQAHPFVCKSIQVCRIKWDEVLVLLLYRRILLSCNPSTPVFRAAVYRCTGCGLHKRSWQPRWALAVSFVPGNKVENLVEECGLDSVIHIRFHICYSGKMPTTLKQSSIGVWWVGEELESTLVQTVYF